MVCGPSLAFSFGPKLNSIISTLHKILFQNPDATCVMALNSLFNKIYVVLFPFIIVTFTCSLLAVIYRAAVMIVPKIAIFWNKNTNTILATAAQICKDENVCKLVLNINITFFVLQYAKYFFLQQLEKNIDAITMRLLLQELRSAQEHMNSVV